MAVPMTQLSYVKTNYEIGLISIGEAILKDSLRTAGQVFIRTMTTPAQAMEITQSFLFINGSGLERTIQTFGLSYRPEALRELFFSWGSSYRQSRLLSATTQVATS